MAKKSSGTKPPRSSAAPAQNKSKTNRRFSTGASVFTDLFKLSVATGLKHIGWLFKDDKDHWEPMEHCHHFYTVSKKGEFEKYCSPNAGHFHAVDVLRDAKGEMILDKEGHPQIKIGPPLQMVAFKEGGIKKRKIDKVFLFTRDGENIYDEHKHEGIYLRSGKARLNMLTKENAARASDILTELQAREPKFPTGASGS